MFKTNLEILEEIKTRDITQPFPIPIEDLVARFDDLVSKVNLIKANTDNTTADIFILATGKVPEQDDLDRCDCLDAGTKGHELCGWDGERDMPRFVPGDNLAKG